MPCKVTQFLPEKEIEAMDQEPEHGFRDGASHLATFICKAQLVRSDGSVAKGMLRIGTRSFDQWVDAVERVIEQENPEE